MEEFALDNHACTKLIEDFSYNIINIISSDLGNFRLGWSVFAEDLSEKLIFEGEGKIVHAQTSR